jgi:hypothetical protein
VVKESPLKHANPAVQRQIERLTQYLPSGKTLNLETKTRYFSQRDNYRDAHRTCNSSSNAMYLDWLLRMIGKPGLDSDDGYLAVYDGYVVRRISFDGTSDHGDLSGLADDDHSQYLLLNGNAARNQVSGVIDVSDGYLLLPTVLPTINVSDGQIASSNGITYVYDGYRTKWLSTNRQYLTSGKGGNSKDIYLRTVDNIATSATGLRMIRNGTIVGMVGQTTGVSTWSFQVRKNGVLAPIASITITAATGGSSSLINVDFSAGDVLQFYANTAGINIVSPVCITEVAWRG